MALARPDGSRDLRIEDVSNRWIVHPAARLLLPAAIGLRISANAVSVAGLAFGAAAAAALQRWHDWRFVALAGLLCLAWLIADGLDGMIARATGTASDLGRFLDGVCDHAVFVMLYVSLAASVGTAGGWMLAAAAGLAHFIQATLYEGERSRYHRRVKGDAGLRKAVAQPNPLVAAYDAVAGSLDRLAAPFDRRLATAADAAAMARAYGAGAAGPMRLMALLSNNMRVVLICGACLAGDPRLFWWAELGPLSVIAMAGLWWHRRSEAAVAA